MSESLSFGADEPGTMPENTVRVRRRAAAAGPVGEAGREPAHTFSAAVVALAALLGLFAIGRHWAPNRWLFRDNAFYATVARGLVENFSLRQEALQPRSWYERDLTWNRDLDAAWSNVSVGRHGAWYPKHPFLMPFLAAPFLWAFGPTGTLAFHFLFFVLLALLTYRVAARVASRPAALAAAAAFVATPWIFDRAWGFGNDVFLSVLVLLSVDAALGGSARVSGAVLGLSFLAKATNLLYAPALALVFALRRDWRGLVRFVSFALPGGLLFLAANWALFGSPLTTAYDRVLVRAAGAATTHSVAGDFHFEALRSSLERAIAGPEGFRDLFPLFFPALAGLALLLARRWKDGVVLAWCVVVPVLVHAPFAWYRLEFNLPQIALSAAPLAALLPPFAGPSEDPPARVRWARLAPFIVVIALIVGGIGRRLVETPRDYLWEQLPKASVFLGDVPCDYFNPQLERWECSHFDNNDWYMTGRVLGSALSFSGRKVDVVLLHPHPSGKERRLEYNGVPMQKRLVLSYGLADHARADATVQLKVLVNGQPVLEEEVRGRGLREQAIETPQLAGQKATIAFVVTAADANWCIFGVAGSPKD